MTLFYCPLVRYKERYTHQLSDWYERNWREYGVNYEKIDCYESATIRAGVVVDVVTHPLQCFGQIEEILVAMKDGRITDKDVIFFDDFWTPGLEALRYAMDLTGVRPKLYSYLWAQSVDEYDFTAQKMKDWIRFVEWGYGKIYDGIFVANTLLKHLVVDNFVADKDKVHVVGLPFDSQEVLSRCPEHYEILDNGSCVRSPHPRKNQVVFSSRWDSEKQPGFFLQVVDKVLKGRPDTQFVVCTSQEHLRSNNPKLLNDLEAAEIHFDGRLRVMTGLTKEQYYATLCASKVQFNCAKQDWTSFTLLEASVCGCYPVYPNFRSFPETFERKSCFMYNHDDTGAAAKRIVEALDYPDDTLWAYDAIEKRAWIHRRFDDTWKRMLSVMGFYHEEVDAPFGPREVTVK